MKAASSKRHRATLAYMSIMAKVKRAAKELRLLSLYQGFEHVVILILTALIAVVVVAAVWNLIWVFSIRRVEVKA